MSNANPPRSAHVTITYADGTTDSVELIGHNEGRELMAFIEFERPPMERPPTGQWREYEPGPFTFASFQVSGTVLRRTTTPPTA